MRITCIYRIFNFFDDVGAERKLQLNVEKKIFYTGTK